MGDAAEHTALKMLSFHLQPGLLLLRIDHFPVQCNPHLSRGRPDKYLLISSDPPVICEHLQLPDLAHDASDRKYDISALRSFLFGNIIKNMHSRLISGIFPDIADSQRDDPVSAGHIDELLRHLRHPSRRAFILFRNGKLLPESCRHAG